MGRPWEYPRWRRVLMQAVMWVVLAGTVGLAQLVVVQRSHAPITLEPRIRVGTLWVRLPSKWVLTDVSDPARGIVQAVDEEQSRELTVVVELGPPDRDVRRQADQPGMASQPIDFKGLGRPGVLLEKETALRTQDGGMVPENLLVALTQLPAGYVVEVRVRQEGARLGGGDPRLVQAVANAITWAGPEKPKKRLPPLPDRPVEFY